MSAGVARSGLGDVPQALRLGEAGQLLVGLILDLPDALPGDYVRPPDFIQGAPVLAAEPVAELEDAALAVAQRVEDVPQGLVAELGLRGGLRGDGLVVGEELA